jgi:hypothetical protein
LGGTAPPRGGAAVHPRGDIFNSIGGGSSNSWRGRRCGDNGVSPQCSAVRQLHGGEHLLGATRRSDGAQRRGCRGGGISSTAGCGCSWPAPPSSLLLPHPSSSRTAVRRLQDGRHSADGQGSSAPRVAARSSPPLLRLLYSSPSYSFPWWQANRFGWGRKPGGGGTGR